MINFTEYIVFFEFSTSCWEVKLIDFTGYLYWILFNFSTFRPLAGRSKSLILLNILIFFDFSTSLWEVKMIIFTEYIDFFRLFDLLMGGQTVRFYWIFILNFSTSRPLTGRSKSLILLNICIFSTFRLFNLLVGVQIDSFYWIILDFLDFSTFRAVAGRSIWFILMNILNFIDFLTLRYVGGRSKWLILLNILFFRLFNF